MFKINIYKLKTLFSLIIPVVIQNFILSSVNLVDNLMVGQLGEVAISGIGSANSFYFIVTCVFSGFVGGCIIYFSQHYGAKNIQIIKDIFKIMTLVMSLFGALVMFTVLFFAPNIIGLFHSNQEVINSTVGYLRIIALSYIPLALTFAFSNCLKSVKETKQPMYISIIAIAINVILNYFLIFGHFGFPKLGINGAAIATLIARLIETLLYFYVLKRSELEFKFNIKEIFIFDYSLFKTIVFKTLPLIFNEFLFSFGLSWVFRLYASKGIISSSAKAIHNTIFGTLFFIVAGFSVATTVMVGHCLGQNKLNQAKEDASYLLRFSFSCGIVIGLISYLITPLILNLFNVSHASKEYALFFLNFAAFCFWIYMVTTELFFIIRTGGDTKSILILDGIFMWVINIPILSYVVYFTNFGIKEIFLLEQFICFVKLLVAYYLYHKRKWLKNIV